MNTNNKVCCYATVIVITGVDLIQNKETFNTEVNFIWNDSQLW